jgi:hypothetical protein
LICSNKSYDVEPSFQVLGAGAWYHVIGSLYVVTVGESNLFNDVNRETKIYMMNVNTMKMTLMHEKRIDDDAFFRCYSMVGYVYEGGRTQYINEYDVL